MKEKLSDIIYNAILKDIVTGVYTSRDFISEAQICSKIRSQQSPCKGGNAHSGKRGLLGQLSQARVYDKCLHCRGNK